MRRIQLKTITKPGQEAIYYGTWIKDIIAVPKDPRVGMTVDEMRQIIPIFNKLEGDPIYILLEEAEHKLLCELVKNYRFARFTAEIIAFADDIIGAKEAQMKVVEEDVPDEDDSPVEEAAAASE
jgi:hypothetical protein